jgi:hypothetical protein
MVTRCRRLLGGCGWAVEVTVGWRGACPMPRALRPGRAPDATSVSSTPVWLLKAAVWDLGSPGGCYAVSLLRGEN